MSTFFVFQRGKKKRYPFALKESFNKDKKNLCWNIHSSSLRRQQLITATPPPTTEAPALALPTPVASRQRRRHERQQRRRRRRQLRKRILSSRCVGQTRACQRQRVLNAIFQINGRGRDTKTEKGCVSNVSCVVVQRVSFLLQVLYVSLYLSLGVFRVSLSECFVSLSLSLSRSVVHVNAIFERYFEIFCFFDERGLKKSLAGGGGSVNNLCLQCLQHHASSFAAKAFATTPQNSPPFGIFPFVIVASL